MKHLVIPAVLLAIAVVSARSGGPEDPPDAGSATAVGVPPSSVPNRHYPSNRPPLTVSPLVKLPIGAIEPRGWLMAQLRLMRDGFTGRLAEVSRFLGDDSGWITMKGKGWEEMPYWLKGYGDLGYLLKDAAVRKETERWLGHAFRSQARDGYFGPADNRAALDLWPNMVMLAALQSYHEATGDRRVLDLMSRYFQFELHLPEDQLLPGSWQKLRGGENLESVYWLYNRTGEGFLLDLAKRIDRPNGGLGLAHPQRRARRALGRELVLSRRQHRHGLPLSRPVLPADARRRPARGRRAQLPPGHGPLRPPAGRDVRRRREHPAGPRGPAPGRRDLHHGRVHGQLRVAAEDHRRDRLGRPGRGGGVQLPAGLHDPRPQRPPLSQRGQPRSRATAAASTISRIPALSCRSIPGATAAVSTTSLSAGPGSPSTSGWPPPTTAWPLRSTRHRQSGPRSPKEADVEISEETAYPFGDEVLLTVACERPVAFPLYLRLPGWARTVRVVLNGRPLEGDFPGGALRRPAPDLAARRPGAAGIRACDRGRPLAVRAAAPYPSGGGRSGTRCG
ncbi:MAG: glycoside hydrolase family 127 protein [Candidatus Moduliflexus flocculans]|nr:glycoside hydrolase family 127 protein [Candidatus Moduliflexus flocculans]